MKNIITARGICFSGTVIIEVRQVHTPSYTRRKRRLYIPNGAYRILRVAGSMDFLYTLYVGECRMSANKPLSFASAIFSVDEKSIIYVESDHLVEVWFFAIKEAAQ